MEKKDKTKKLKKEIQDLKYKNIEIKVRLEEKEKILEGKLRTPSFFDLFRKISKIDYTDKQILNFALISKGLSPIETIQTPIDTKDPKMSYATALHTMDDFFICRVTCKDNSEYEIVYDDKDNYKWIKKVFNSIII